MESPLALLDSELAKRLQTLTWEARRGVDGQWVGAHRSRQFGSSLEFAEHKEYAVGDDPRHLDWKAYARFDRYTIKKYENESNLRTLLLLDASASMGYGEAATNKLAYARTLAAALAYLSLRQDDAAGLFLLDETAHHFLPPRASTLHVQEITRTLLAASAANKTDLARALDQVAERVSGRVRLVLLSDAFCDTDGLVGRLARLAARGGEVSFLHVLHRDELTLPFENLSEIECMETGERLLADPVPLRADYQARLRAFCTHLAESLAEHGIRYVSAVTDTPPIEAILALVAGSEAA